MANVLTTASNISCGHEPSANNAQSQAKLKVKDNSVLLPDSITGLTISVCATPKVSDPVSEECKGITAITAGIAAKLKSNDQAVVLDSLKGQTDGTISNVTPQLMLNATANQTKLRAT